jgi:hypothetical protein
MRNFLAVFIGTDEASAKWEKLDEKTQAEREKAGMGAWHAWMVKNQSSIVVPGAPLGTTLKVGPTGVSDTSNSLCGYIVIQAESHAAAAKLFVDHPHFKIFPGDSVEIMECLDIPKPRPGM